MLAMFSITTPIFLLIAVGYAAVKAQLVSAEANQGFGRFVLYFGLPALIFRAVSSLEIADVFNPGYVAGYAVGSLLAFVFGLWVTRWWGAEGFPGALGSMGVSLSNSGFIGYPLMLLAFATPPAAEFAMVLLVENILMLPLILAVLEYGVGRRNGDSGILLWRSLARRVLGAPIFIAIVLGAVASLLELSVPVVLDRGLELLAGAAAPVALFVIGGSLVGASLKGVGWHGVSIILGKLAVHPLLVAIVMSLMPGVTPELRGIGVLFAAMPMASLYPVFGGGYGQQVACSAVLLITTVVAFFTISLYLGLLL